MEFIFIEKEEKFISFTFYNISYLQKNIPIKLKKKEFMSDIKAIIKNFLRKSKDLIMCFKKLK